MDPFSTLVHGSRRPFKTKCISSLIPNKDIVAVAAPHRIPSPHVQPLPLPIQSSSRRRKPLITYRSPGSHHPVGIFIERQHSNDNSTTESTTPPPLPTTTNISLSYPAYISASPSTFSPRASSHSSFKAASRPSSTKPLTTSSIYALAPPLPLYHPLGTLALSLLPLSPTTSGEIIPEHLAVPLQPDIPQASTSRSRPSASRNRSSARSRKVVARVRDKLDSGPLIGCIENPKDKDDSEVASPRKRRAAAAAANSALSTLPGELDGIATKRKRKEVGDDDSPVPTPPPPKRSRNRNGANSSVPVHTSPSPSENLRAQEDDMAVDINEDPPLNSGSGKTNVRAKRATRSAGGGTRRNGGRRAARREREKEKDKDKDSSVEDDDSLPSMPVVQVVTISAEVAAHENALPVTIIEEPEIKPFE